MGNKKNIYIGIGLIILMIIVVSFVLLNDKESEDCIENCSDRDCVMECARKHNEALNLTTNQTENEVFRDVNDLEFEIIEGEGMIDLETMTYTMNPKLLNQTPRLIVYCEPFGEDAEYVYWHYSTCAMLETITTPISYDAKFKEYNICFYLTNNKTVGDCVM